MSLCIEKSEDNPFRLRHTIEKLISQSDHIDNLFELANSPDHYSTLQSSLEVIILSSKTCPPISPKLPKSEQEWKSIFTAENLEDTGDWSDMAKKLANYSTTKMCRIHCECKVVQHLSNQQLERNQGNNTPPPCNYIGVSKLSCGACRVWLEAFNELSEQRLFYIKGSHGAWYWPWGMAIVKVPLEELMVIKLRTAYIKHQSRDARTESTIACVTRKISPRLSIDERVSIFSRWVAQKIQKY